ncbi:MAG: T9SS type A sorting domain-containing protein, partial [FCB group bacterium]|nr:T9SS type A sorting domain-containing protein [FCB group bacterium]
YSEDGSHPGTYPEDYPDVLTTKNGSVIALKYGNNKTAAVSYEGTAPGGTVPGKVMVMGFPFETITTPAAKQEVAGYILLFMGYDIIVGAHPLIPQTAELYQNYPNPFNPLTRIVYGIPEAAHVALEVFNLRGERVRQLVNERRHAGRHEVIFNGTNLPSGVYVYRLSVNNRTISAKKMALSK